MIMQDLKGLEITQLSTNHLLKYVIMNFLNKKIFLETKSSFLKFFQT